MTDEGVHARADVKQRFTGIQTLTQLHTRK